MLTLRGKLGRGTDEVALLRNRTFSRSCQHVGMQANVSQPKIGLLVKASHDDSILWEAGFTAVS